MTSSRAMPRLGLAAVLALTMALLAALVLPALADAAKRRGVQRNYAGAAWSGTPDSAGFYAKLRLDSARAADYKSGGYVGETLWVASNKSPTRFGRNKRTPYVQVSVTRGYRGSNSNQIVISQRNSKGRYFEGRSPGPKVKYGQTYAFSIVGQVGGVFRIGLGPDEIATAKNAGKQFGSRSAYAGVESTSGRNRARGKVSDLAWLVVNGKSAGAFPNWALGDGHDSGAKLIKRGPGRVAWKEKYRELNNSFGR